MAVLACGLVPMVHAQEAAAPSYEEDWYTEIDSSAEDMDSANVPSDDKFFLTYNWGAAASWLTRIINQTERSNFVFKDFLAGLYFEADLHNIKYGTPLIRLTAYYPITSTFNEMPQKPNTPLHFGADMLAGLKFGLLDTQYIRADAGLALHLFFLNADRWNYFNLGGAAVAGIELPLTKRWTLLIGGGASVDNGNLGGNREMEPFDIVYQYQVNLGARYSKKKQNTSSVFDVFDGFKTQNKKSSNNNDKFDEFEDAVKEGEGFRR
jgi:hypothetical protein